MHHCRRSSKLLKSVSLLQLRADSVSPTQQVFAACASTEANVVNCTAGNEQVQFDFATTLAVRNALFNETKKKQLAKLVPRIEKIEVRYQGRGISDNAVMFMNKHLSTPYHCALHISKTVADSAVLAIVTPQNNIENPMLLPVKHEGNENQLVKVEPSSKPTPLIWDMHTPIPCDCKLEILQMNMENSSKTNHDYVNKAYWNSCTLVLGAVMQEAFKENYTVGLCHLPFISERRGAFCYDIALDERLHSWQPKDTDLVYFTKLARSIISKNLKFERLEISVDCAKEMFVNDEFQLNRISLLQQSKGNDIPVVIYRFGDYVDVSAGPHISNTSQMYHYVVTAIHKLRSATGENIRRVQGISLPKDLRVHHMVWSMLESRARKPVKQNLGNLEFEEAEVDKNQLRSIENKTKQYMISTGQWREGQWKETEKAFKPDNET